MRQPEWFEPYDLTRVTASIGFEGTVRSRPLNMTLAWGGNREFNGFNGNADGYLLEWDLGVSQRSTLYGRAEVADTDLFGLGLHPKGFSHRHVFYKVGVVTAGYLRDFMGTDEEVESASAPTRRFTGCLTISCSTGSLRTPITCFYAGARAHPRRIDTSRPYIPARLPQSWMNAFLISPGLLIVS